MPPASHPLQCCRKFVALELSENPALSSSNCLRLTHHLPLHQTLLLSFFFAFFFFLFLPKNRPSENQTSMPSLLSQLYKPPSWSGKEYETKRRWRTSEIPIYRLGMNQWRAGSFINCQRYIQKLLNRRSTIQKVWPTGGAVVSHFVVRKERRFYREML